MVPLTSSLTELVNVYKALGHPVRLRILAMLRTGELCACQVTAVLKLAPSTVSAHLSELRRAGVLVERKQGRWVIFRHAEDAQARIANALESLTGDVRIEADARIVRHLRRVPIEKLCRADLDLARVGIKESPLARTRVRRGRSHSGFASGGSGGGSPPLHSGDQIHFGRRVRVRGLGGREPPAS